MAYFSHAYRKTIIMSDYISPVPATPTADSSALTAGQVSLYDAQTWNPLDVTTPACCQFILAAGSPYTNDRIGPFHGGYTESIKSKGIQPKYINRYWIQDGHAAQASILHIGATAFNIATPPAEGDCCHDFLCGEQYHLRVDVKGDPVLRTLNHQGYVEVTADGGCCPDGTVVPTPVSPTGMYIQWAEQILASVVVTGNGPNGRANPEPFIIPVVTDSPLGVATTLYYPPGTDAAVLAAGAVASGLATDTWDNWVDPGFTATDCGGLTLVGAYMDTQFGDCTFQPSDWYNKEPVRIFASEVDLNGDPCEFAGLCVQHECTGYQAEGLGESAARDFILSESYRQNPFATDLRIREITQGNDLLTDDAAANPGRVQRTGLYDRTMLLHSVPRFNNPSGTFDNDQYIVEILSLQDGGAAEAARDALRADIATLLACPNAECATEPATATAECAAPTVVVVA